MAVVWVRAYAALCSGMELTECCRSYLQLVSEGSYPLVGVPAAGESPSDGRGQEGSDQDQSRLGVDQVQCVSDTLGPLLDGLSPLQQGVIDGRLMECCREHGEVVMGTELAVSMACARAAEAGPLPLPYHLAQVMMEEVRLLECGEGWKRAAFSLSCYSPTQPPPLCLPFLVCPVLCSGQGKLRLRRFSVTPLPGVTFPEQVEHLTRFHRALREKLGVCASALLLLAQPVCLWVTLPLACFSPRVM